MEIIKTVQPDSITLKVVGRLDAVSSPELEKEIEPLLAQTNHLILDFEELSYISSAGLRVLLITQKAIFGTGCLEIIHVNKTVRDVLSVTGFDNILTIR